MRHWILVAGARWINVSEGRTDGQTVRYGTASRYLSVVVVMPVRSVCQGVEDEAPSVAGLSPRTQT
jgi:hypothetical protein